MMSTQQIAKRLAELMSKGKFEDAQKELFADDAVSIEPQQSEAFAKEIRGLPAIIEKGHKFQSILTAAEREAIETAFFLELSYPKLLRG